MFTSLCPPQMPSNRVWIVIFNLNKPPVLIVQVHCPAQFSYRAYYGKGVWGKGKGVDMNGYTEQPNARVVSCATYPSTSTRLSPVYSILYRCMRRDSPCPVEKIRSVLFIFLLKCSSDNSYNKIWENENFLIKHYNLILIASICVKCS